jgi:hypothetical protein
MAAIAVVLATGCGGDADSDAAEVAAGAELETLLGTGKVRSKAIEPDPS